MAVKHSIIIAVVVLWTACGPRSDTLALRTSDTLPVPPPPTTQKFAPPATPTPPLEPFGRAAYVGGTFRGWVTRFDGTLTRQGEQLEFVVPPDAFVWIPLKTIRAAEYGAKPGRDANRLTIFDGAEKESHYLTLRYADRTSQEQVIVLDLAQKTVEETLRFIEQAGIAIEYQHH